MMDELSFGEKYEGWVGGLGGKIRPAISTPHPLQSIFRAERFVLKNHLLSGFILQEYIYSGCNFVSLVGLFIKKSFK